MENFNIIKIHKVYINFGKSLEDCCKSTRVIIVNKGTKISL